MSATIPFLLQNSSLTSFVYAPFGVRTLKVAVASTVPLAPLRIRPKHIKPEDVEAGHIRGYADDSKTFVVSWGGGHEPGPCVVAEDFLVAFETCAEISPANSYLIFFNLHHVGPDLPEQATLTLELFDPETDDVVGEKRIVLNKPNDYPETAVRWQSSGTRWKFKGTHLQKYDPRWWPEPELVYKPLQDRLPLSIEQQGNQLTVLWEKRPIMLIIDNSEPTILEGNNSFFELFHFDEWHIALRLWFFWQDTNLGGSFFVGRHEVPDAERFDLLIDRQSGNVALACTDAHWRETWGIPTERPLRGTMGLDSKMTLELIREQWDTLWNNIQGKEKAKHTQPYNPIRYIRRLAANIGANRQETVRAKGTEAHMPALHNVTQTDDGTRPPRMTSSDVRLTTKSNY